MIPSGDADALASDRLLAVLERLLALEATELGPTLDRAAQIVAEVLGADKVDVFVYEAASASLVARGRSDTRMGRRQRAIGMDRLPLANGGRAVEVFRTGRPHLDGRVDQDEQELWGLRGGLGVRSQLLCPLEVAGERRGVLDAMSAEPDRFTAEDLRFFEAVARWMGLVTHRAELVQALVNQAEQQGRRAATERLVQHLSPRQREVAALIARGYSNARIAEELVLTRGTVTNHVEHILRRLGAENRSQVAAWMAELGLHHAD